MDLDNEELEKTKKNHYKYDEKHKNEKFEMKFGSRRYGTNIFNFRQITRFIFSHIKDRYELDCIYIDLISIIKEEYQLKRKENENKHNERGRHNKI